MGSGGRAGEEEEDAAPAAGLPEGEDADPFVLLVAVGLRSVARGFADDAEDDDAEAACGFSLLLTELLELEMLERCVEGPDPDGASLSAFSSPPFVRGVVDDPPATGVGGAAGERGGFGVELCFLVNRTFSSSSSSMAA